MGGGQTGLSASAQRVQEVLEAKGVELKVMELPGSTRTAQEAAHAAGCEIGQIVKSLVFKGAKSGEAVLVLTSGSNRVDESRLSEELGEPFGMADADFVRETTGFSIGGVPPVGHRSEISTYIDEDLMGYGNIWAAAGTPRAIFKLTPDELVHITGGKITAVT